MSGAPVPEQLAHPRRGSSSTFTTTPPAHPSSHEKDSTIFAWWAGQHFLTITLDSVRVNIHVLKN
jgi:hypothetical protein